MELAVAAGKPPLTGGDGMMRDARGVQLLKQELDRIGAEEKRASAPPEDQVANAAGNSDNRS